LLTSPALTIVGETVPTLDGREIGSRMWDVLLI
jgi:hypothetical protein